VATRAPRRFRTDHVQFMRACANVLAAAIERARADDELAESEQRFRTLVEVAPDIIFSVATADGVLTALNPAFEAITGWPRADWLGQPLTPLVHPDDLQLVSDAFARLGRGEHLSPFELRVRAQDGAEIVLEVRAAPRQEDGRVVEAFGIARYLTLRRAVEAELRHSRD
jgi:PAS domain S-box-containing protein